jgi:hypothetical protein
MTFRWYFASFSLSLTLDLWIHGLCCCVSLNRTPHVRPLLRVGNTTAFPKTLSFAHGHCQHRHLEQVQISQRNRDWHMGDQPWVPHSQ